MTSENYNPDREQEEYDKKSEEAHANWSKNGRFGVTAADHRYIGGSPPFELSQNQGKTQGELWDKHKLLEELNGLVDFLKRAREELNQDGKDFVRKQMLEDDIRYAKKELSLAIPYLKSIGKLPVEFDDYQIEDLPDDPK